MMRKHQAMGNRPAPSIRLPYVPHPSHVLAAGATVTLTIIDEFDRAAWAAHRYGQWRRRMPAKAARRVYMEFYSG